MKRIAIAGGGLAGLATAWHLLNLGGASVTLFDPKGIGGGASGVSTGLLHPFPGRLALRSWQADEGMNSTLQLIDQVESFTNSSVAHRGGILRLALTEQQKKDFPRCVEFGCEWWPEEKVKERLPEVSRAPALWIPQGMTVYSRPYLGGLWQLCKNKGATLELQPFSSDKNFDHAVLAMGFETPQRIGIFADIPLKITRGQALLCRWKKSPPFTLLSQGHLTPCEDPSLCQLGSTYEDPETPYDEIKAFALQEKIAKFYPPARDFEVVESRVGYRIARQKGYRPILSQIDAKTWAFFGLGSRGLLYHSLLAKSLAYSLLNL
jgi:glycine/D-amino acid oxidase-like deaminating enzyme